MAEMFRLTFNIGAALKQMNVRMTNGVKVGVARGINRTAESEKVALARAVATDTGLKVSDVKKEIAISKATANLLVARVMSHGERIPLINFQARGPVPSRGRGQVTAGVRGQRKSYPGAFIAKVYGPLPTGVVSPGHLGVFRRRGPKRLPIKELFGPSIAHVFGKLVPLGEARRQEVLLKNVSHEIEFALSKGA